MKLLRFAWKMILRVATFTKRYWHTHKRFRMAMGILLIASGFVGFVTPVIPGTILLLIGLEILGFRIVFWEKSRSWFLGKSKIFWRYVWYSIKYSAKAVLILVNFFRWSLVLTYILIAGSMQNLRLRVQH